MESIFTNGGMIGITMDFSSTEQYVVGTTQQRVRPTFVGSQTYARAGSASSVNVNFALTGGTGETTPKDGDLVLLSIAIGANGTTLLSELGTYTTLTRLVANDTYDCILYVGYRIMGAIPDTTFPVMSSISTANAQTATVYVFRNVDQVTPIDIATATTTGTNSRTVNPPAITPVTTNSTIVAIGAGAYTTTNNLYTSSTLTGFNSVLSTDTINSVQGVGYFEWQSGAYDPAAFTITTSTTSDSWCSATVALRPALLDVPVYGNKKNSGIWLLQNLFDAQLKLISDPYFANVSLLLHADGSNGSTTFTDSSQNNKTISVFGNANISTNVYKYGTGSLALDGTGDYLRFTDADALDFSTGDFTIESWIYPTAFVSDAGSIIAGVGPTNGDVMLALRNNTTLSIGRSNVAWDASTTGFTFSTNTWYHIAVSRISGVLKIFVNGTSYYSAANAQSYIILNTSVAIGARQGASGTESYANLFTGYIDELRVTKGVGRYAENFTPATGPFQER